MERVSSMTKNARKKASKLMKRLSSVVAPSEDEVQRKRMRNYRKSMTRRGSAGLSRSTKLPAKKVLLGQRTHTVTTLYHPMFVISYDNVLELFGERDGSRRTKILSFKTLKEMNLLLLKERLPLMSTTIYVSHEWASWKHADPRGIQIRTLCEALKRFAKNSFSWADPEAKKIFRSQIYIWFDWFCIPQHDPDNQDEDHKQIEVERKLAMKSIPAYIERANMMVILAPVRFDSISAY